MKWACNYFSARYKNMAGTIQPTCFRPRQLVGMLDNPL